MLLIVNCIADEASRVRFDRVVAPRLGEAYEGIRCAGHEIRHLVDGGSAGGSSTSPLPAGAGGFDRLLLSGSELSASEQLPTDDALIALIRSFIDAGNPVLGICYGHQMLARALGGRCRRAAIPEFGWKRVDLETENDLFQGWEHPVTLHSHYDEVFDLPDDLRVIASTAECAVQAFQVSGRPIWGVQFHPEMSGDEGCRMLDDNLRTEPLAPELYVDERAEPQHADDNLRLLINFFRARPDAARADAA